MGLADLVRGFKMGVKLVYPRGFELTIPPQTDMSPEEEGIAKIMIPSVYTPKFDEYLEEILLGKSTRSERVGFYMGMLTRPALVYKAHRYFKSGAPF